MSDPTSKSSPFAALAGLREQLPPGPPPRPPEPPKGPAKAVVRFEKKGRGGKEVTVVEQLELSGKEREAWCKALKQSLGAGGFVEDDTIVVQGDHRPRVAAWLTERGVRKVSVG